MLASDEVIPVLAQPSLSVDNIGIHLWLSESFSICDFSLYLRLSSRLHTCSIWCTQGLQIVQPKRWFQSSKTDLSRRKLNSGHAEECWWYQWHQDIWLWVLSLFNLMQKWYDILLVTTYNPWGGMTNNGMKKNVNSQADAEIHLKYLDGDPYTHIPGLTYAFNDGTNQINPFRIKEDNNGDLQLSDHKETKQHEILCQYDCQGKYKYYLILMRTAQKFHCTNDTSCLCFAPVPAFYFARRGAGLNRQIYEMKLRQSNLDFLSTVVSLHFRWGINNWDRR